MARMIAEANLVITAWDDDLLVGIARSLTDFCYICYLADLAVRETYQRQGIGVALIRQTQAALGPQARIIRPAAPAAYSYYPHIGFTHHPRAWMIGDATPADGRRARSDSDLTLARRCGIVGATRSPERDRRGLCEGLRGSPGMAAPPGDARKRSQLGVNWGANEQPVAWLRTQRVSSGWARQRCAGCARFAQTARGAD